MTDPSLAIRGVAHDLNNQIMILLNSLDRLAVLYPDAPDAALALKAAEHCAGLTSQLLPNTRPRRVHHAVSLREVVSEAAMLIRPLLPTFNRLDVDCRSDCRVSINPQDLEQAIVNLAINSIDAMDGPGIIRLEAHHEPGQAIIAISDNGPGVPAHLRDMIFDPLFTTKAHRGGHGLGLARVRDTVTSAGGHIAIYDAYPHGASFRILLPAL